jgi:hypothetical protein
MIRVKPRAEIDDSFKKAVREIGRTFISEFKELTDMRKRRTIETSGIKVKNAMELLKADGIDKLVTKLRSMEFDKFTTETSPRGRKYIVGYTRPIESITYNGSQKSSKVYLMGAYRIYIPLDAFISGSSNTFHLVPDANPYTLDRTPHHYAENYDEVHFLDYYPKFCWAGFATIVSATLNSMDIAELFRSLYLYISVINMSSLYVRSYAEDRLWDKELIHA